MCETRRQRIAGMLEKQSRWRKEWCERFFVLEEDFINYFVSPPAILSDDSLRDEIRGRIPLAGVMAEPLQEPGRPYCIRLGRDIVSCKTEPEQQKWLQAIRAAAHVEATCRTGSFASTADHEVPRSLNGSAHERRKPRECSGQQAELILLNPEGTQKVLQWLEPATVQLSSSRPALLLVLDQPFGQTRALCRLAADRCVPGCHNFPVEPLGRSASSDAGECTLRVEILSSSILHAELWRSSASSFGALGAACLLIWWYSAFVYAVAGLPLMFYSLQSLQRAQHVTFKAEQLVRAERGSREVPSPARSPSNTALREPAPRWSGTWILDKSCSEKYEPILKDMGVNYLIRKAADAKTSVLVISKSATHVNFVVKNLVTVEDLLPVDGAWVPKPVPPAGRMRGEMRLRLTKSTENELEMVTEFPPGEGGLCDTLVVDGDGNSFSRRVVRKRSDGTQLECTRVFRRMS